MSPPTAQANPLKETPLTSLHRSLGAKCVAFAGYDMPVQFSAGILKEHLHTRAAAGLFDVSHMGQAFLHAPSHADAAAALERLMPGDFLGLGPGQMRYSMLLNDQGGILDDLMVTRPVGGGALGSGLFLVVNAACKDADFAHIEGSLPNGVRLERFEERALIALQGPQAVLVLTRMIPEVSSLVFMEAGEFVWNGAALFVSRSGYTGEDGFEISVPAETAEAFAQALLDQEEVQPVGLGARDSLRLEAGLCLYGHDIDETTSPIEASLSWAVSKRRRAEADFPGAERILAELSDGPARKRVGLRLAGRQPAREGSEITFDGNSAGRVTSGGFAPSLGAPIAMGYVPKETSKKGTPCGVLVRGKTLEAEISTMPFVANNYVR